MEYNKEQLNVVDLLLENDVCITGIAGTGKSTTIECIAENIEANILAIVYNDNLINNFKKISNLYVNSYYSISNSKCDADLSIGSIELNNCELEKLSNSDTDKFVDLPLGKFSNLELDKYIDLPIDILIIDDVQDLTFQYYFFIKNIIKILDIRRICIIGSYEQSINQFKGSDIRFLKKCNEVFNTNFITVNFTNLYRNIGFLKNIEQFSNLNNCDLNKSDLKPKYIHCNLFETEKIIEVVENYINEFSAKLCDILILAPSVRSRSEKSPINILRNELIKKYCTYISTDCDDVFNHSIYTPNYSDKILICSYHQAKGITRKYVLVLNFDTSYFVYFNREADKKKCSPELYVALTRASEHITVFQSSNKMVFFKPLNIKLECKVSYCNKNCFNKIIENNYTEQHKIKKSINDLLRNVPDDLYKNIPIKQIEHSCIDIYNYVQKSKNIKKSTYVEISTVELKKNKRMSINDHIQNSFIDYFNMIKYMDNDIYSSFYSFVNGYIVNSQETERKTEQETEQETILNNIINDNSIICMPYKLEYKNSSVTNKIYEIIGYTDIINENDLYKICNSLCDILELVIQIYKFKNKNYYIINDDTIYKVIYDTDELNKFVEKIITLDLNTYYSNISEKSMTDKEFIAKCMKN